MSKPLRETMPQTAEFIDQCRAAFGTEMVNDMIRLGMQGAKTFYASENGVEVGTRIPDPVKFVTADKMALRPFSKESEQLRYTRGRK